MRVAIFNWHTPYVTMLARALPDVQFFVIPTAHAPTGWRGDQRPRCRNVQAWPYRSGERIPPDAADVWIAQTPMDLRCLTMDSDYRYIHWPLVYLAHNHARLDWPDGAFRPQRPSDVRLVAISERKADSYRLGGWDEPVTAIPPGINRNEYEPSPYGGDYVLTVVNNIRRPLFDLSLWLQAANGLPIRLVGESNEGIPGAVGPSHSWDALRAEYRGARSYLNPTCPPFEDAYNLASLEAAACGCPVINLHGQHPPITDFPADVFAARWRKVLEEVAG